MIMDTMMKLEVTEATTSVDRDAISIQNARIEQAGAICLRKRKGQDVAEVLLIGSRRNGRWGIPKGHVEVGEASRHTAQREAFEEAGVEGKALKKVVGSFTYRKDGSPFQYRVTVHILHVRQLVENFPEKGLRKTKWVPITAASREVARSGLSEIFRDII
ncbi:NUDIX hydrolase [Agrobacterium sp. SHOUNA12C]|nr:NUDIX hydrolase [Agrobacterium sp. BETTINA12B]MCJ9755193.1 NUDIX hydrolase [Agrobacterium sp. SHOUNA12C]